MIFMPLITTIATNPNYTHDIIWIYTTLDIHDHTSDKLLHHQWNYHFLAVLEGILKPRLYSSSTPSQYCSYARESKTTLPRPFHHKGQLDSAGLSIQLLHASFIDGQELATVKPSSFVCSNYLLYFSLLAMLFIHFCLRAP